MAALQLLPEQTTALAKLQEFARDPQGRLFVLRGYAGTGKTTILKAFADWLEDQDQQPVLLATTGRAAKVLQQKADRSATTIHRCIYRFDELAGMDTGEQEAGQLTLQFDLREAPPSEQARVYIVDEASMIAATATTGNAAAAFGSGNLLDDLISFTEGDKLVFVGDPAQLPPVSTDPRSLALSPNFLRRTFGLPVAQAELRQIIRQESESAILRLAGDYRRCLDQQQFHKWPKVAFPWGPGVQTYPNEAALVAAYLPVLQRKAYGEACMIVHANRHCRALNHRLRKTLFGHTQIQPGELLMVVQNNYPTGLSNGDQVIVDAIRGSERRAGFTFLRARIRNLHDDHQQAVLLIRDLLYNNFAGLQAAETQRLLIDFTRRMQRQGIKRKSVAFQEAMQTDPYLNALRCKFGYVLTCHKAQGGEWPEVFLNLRSSVFGLDRSLPYRWMYTALTRPRQVLHLNDGFWFFGFEKRQPQTVAKFFRQRQQAKGRPKPPKP